MKSLVKSIFLLLFVFLFGSLTAQNEPGVQVEKIKNNLYKFTLTTTFSVNMSVFTGSDGILLIDTGMPGITEQISTKIKELSDKEIKYIINTHHHPDHISGNQLLGKNAIKIAHKNFVTKLTTGLNILQEYSQDVLPQITFYDEMYLNFNDEEIKLIALPGTHSDNDVIVYFPGYNVACISSIVTPRTFPYIGRNDGGSVINYDKILDKMLTLFDEETVFITGHGQNATYSDIQDYRDMISKTKTKIQNGLANGKSVKELQEDNILNEWESWGQGFVTTNAWIQTIGTAINPQPVSNKESIAIPMFYTMKEKGIDACIEQYEQLKNSQPNKYDFREFNLNLFGYSLLGKNKFDEAIKIFKLNVEVFPESANVYDSLGEAYERSGNKEKALENYRIAVQNAEKNNDANLNVFKTNLQRMQN